VRLAAAVLACMAMACVGGADVELDAGVEEPDASSDEQLALEDGTYELAWECLSGCSPLLFPPQNYNRLVVSESLLLTFATADTTNEQAVLSAPADSGCVVSAALTYSTGSTGPISFCPAVGGAQAEVTYTARYGEGPPRVYRVTAIPALLE
jgi:hypothetical protein